MTDQLAPNRPPLNRARLRVALLAVGLAAVLAVPMFAGLGPDSKSVRAPPAATRNSFAPLLDSPDAIAAQVVSEMEAIAQGSAASMAQAGAEAAAEYEALSKEASQVVARASGEAESSVAAASTLRGGLQTAPEDFDGTVAPSPGSGRAPDYSAGGTGGSGGQGSEWVDYEATPYDGSNAQTRARLALNIPQTGIAALDANGLVIVGLYVRVMDNGRSAATNEVDDDIDGENTATVGEDSFGAVKSNGTAASYQAAPDWRGANAAVAHARDLMGKANATLSSILSGVKANVAVQASLVAQVEAEINATLAAKQTAKAEIQAQAEANVNATFAASAQAEAQAHAAAEHQVEVIREAHLEAKQKVHAQAEQQAELVTTAAAQAQEQLRAQAAAALEAGAKAAAQIQAAAQLAVEAVANAPGVNGTEAGARAKAIMAMAASAMASAQARANATANALLEQAASVGAQVDVRIKAILAAEARAEASLEAKAEVAIRATLRAEAYTVAKIRINAQTQANAHLKAAAKAQMTLENSADAHIRTTIKAALGLTAAAKISFDGSQQIGKNANATMDAETTKDIDYVREVAADYKRENNPPSYQAQGDHYAELAEDLDMEKYFVSDVAIELEKQVSEGLKIVGFVEDDLKLLGQDYL